MKTSLETHITNAPAGTAWLFAVLLSANLAASASTVGYWRFEEGTPPNPATGTGTILDSSGHGLNGNPLGGPTYSSDIATIASLSGTTTSMHFNGSSQQIFIPDYAAFQLTHSLTIEAFIKTEPLVPGTGNQGQILFRGDNRPGLDPYWLSVLPGNVLQFGINSTSAGAALTTTIPASQWIHVAGTLDDATGQMKLYVNGAVASSTTTSVRPLATLDPGWLPGVGIGCDQDTLYAELFHGWIDEVRLSDAALSPGQMLIPEPSGAALAGLGLLLALLSRRNNPRGARL